MTRDLVIRNAEVGGRPGQDVQILDGRIGEIGPRIASPGPTEELDAGGGALIPGLIDHHIHLMATAARADSLPLDEAADAADLAARLKAFTRNRPRGSWIRAVGYHEPIAGLLDRQKLDALVLENPVRVQHRSGALWILNSRGLEIVTRSETPDCVERDAHGAPTGRIWRGDAWLRQTLGATPPTLAPLGAALARSGVTGVTDATVTTTPEAAAVLGHARDAGALPQRLHLMSGGPLEANSAWSIGPVKIVPDERDLPALDELTDRIASARLWRRRVAIHCVTATELALTLAAFEAAGSLPGDRIEHGGVIPAAALESILRLGLTVVTQPGFVFARGDRYLAEVDPHEQGDLYRCASLLAAGVSLAASSDAPYASTDPWLAMRAATMRRTRGGYALGEPEQIDAWTALRLYLGSADNPGGPTRRLAPGALADLALLKVPLEDALDTLASDLVAVTLIGGRLVHEPA
jgi:predicted amidohydrolase YtcJ